MPGPDRICLLGHHEPDYPRNRSVKEALEAAGFRVVDCHSRAPFPWRHLILGARLLRISRDVRWILVTEGGHRLVPLVKALALLTGRKVAFDPFTSRYNTRIEDRKLHSRFGLQALICLWQDWSSTRCADFLFFDTAEHEAYFRRKYGVKAPSAILPVGVDEAVFRPGPGAGGGEAAPEAASRRTGGEAAGTSGAAAASEPGCGFRVLFYGTYIPLQGVEHVVEAAALLRDEGVRFTLVGRGQTYAAVRARAGDLGLDPAIFSDPVPPEALADSIRRADLCLGIFGDTGKAANVVPNKVVQAAAMGKAIVTRDSPAVRGYFRGGESAVLVPAASADALAAAIRALKDDAERRDALGRAARRVFEESFSGRALAEVLRKALG